MSTLTARGVDSSVTTVYLQGIDSGEIISVRERNASPHTIASYRDTIRLLLTYASQKLGVEPSRLDLGQLDAPLIAAFLDHLETDRGCGPRTRNTRLAAIRTFTATAWCAIQNTPPRSSGSCRSDPNATNARSSPISPSPNSTRSSTLQTARVGPVAATTRSSSCSPRLDSGPQR